MSCSAGLALLLLGACSSTEGLLSPSGGGGAPSSGSFTERFTNLFSSGASGNAQGAAVNQPQDDWECPRVDIRQGASTLAVNGPGEAGATNLRYQATIGQTARECAKLGAAMTMKVGVQGRVILGPAGGAGQLDVPLRYAVVQEGPNPKTIWTKLYRIPVQMAGDQSNVPFIHVEEDVTFPTPNSAELDAYVVYVGFDQLGAREKPERRRKKRGR